MRGPSVQLERRSRTPAARGVRRGAIDNPLRGLSGDAQEVEDFLSTIEGQIVLVGHSYGGAVITNAAAGNANVKALIYVDAAAPDVGETTGQLSGKTSALMETPRRSSTACRTPVPRTGPCSTT